MRIKISLIALVLVFYLSQGIASEINDPTSESGVNLNGAIEIANAEAIKWGYDPNSVDLGRHLNIKVTIYADDENSKWKEHLTSEVNQWPQEYVLPKLEGKTYWAMLYKRDLPAGMMGGNNFWIFIDKNDGSIITQAADQ